MSQYIRYPTYGAGIIEVANFASLPVGPPQGEFAFDLATNTLYIYNGGQWVPIGGDVAPTANISFKATVSGAQTITPGAGEVKVNFPTEIFDNGGYYNAGSSRFTPLVAGVYYFKSCVSYEAPATNSADTQNSLKNNATYLGRTIGNIAVNASTSHQVSCIAEMNGSTDYVEPYTFLTGNGGNAVNLNGVASFNWFEGYLIFRN